MYLKHFEIKIYCPLVYSRTTVRIDQVVEGEYIEAGENNLAIVCFI